MNYLLPDEWYDRIKWAVTVLLPALTVLYVALAAIWAWPLAEQVERTLVAVYTFLCSLMGISGAKAYLEKRKVTSDGEDW